MLPARISERRSGQLPHHGKRSILDDDFFSKLAEEADKEEEVSDVSEADPLALLESLQDADNMDADLFGSKKMVGNIPAPAGTSSGDREPKSKLQQEQKRQEMVSPERVLKRDELIFNDEEDDLMDALGFGESPKRKAAMSVGERDSEPALPLQSRLDDVVSRGSSLHPPAEEKDNLVEQKLITKEDDFIFGSYQPTLATSLEGRQSRRPSVRFSTEDVNSLLPERKRSSATTASPSACPSRPAADWLGLKQEELELKPEQVSLSEDTLKPHPSSPGQPTGRALFSSSFTEPSARSSACTTYSAASPTRMEEDDDWLAGALTRKKAQAAARPGEKGTRPPTARPEEKGTQPLAARPGEKGTGPPAARPEERGNGSPAARSGEKGTGSPGTRSGEKGTRHSAARLEEKGTRSPATRSGEKGTGPSDPLGLGEEVELNSFQSKTTSPAPGRRLEEPPAPMKRSQHSISPPPWEAPDMTAPPSNHSLPEKEDQTKPAGPSSAPQTYTENSSTAIRPQTCGLRQGQDQALLQAVKLQHTQDLELMESTHRASVKQLEEALEELEARRQREMEELKERLAAVTWRAEQEQAELHAQYQRRLSNIQQERDAEVRRLQELQRKSVLEMKRDHDEQVQRLKRLKDEEIDAVTSATAQTRSVSVVMEQMDHISRRLGDLSSRMESSQEQATQNLEQEARQRNEQLRGLQEQLQQQQRAMGEERSRLKEVITKMEAQLSEQQRQLEKERWRAAAEQAKAESAVRSLEEERRTFTHHITMEREELEKAKTALLEEQQSVMQYCAEERKKVAAEWAQLHTQERLRQEAAERESRRMLERDTSREGSIISMAQEQADLRLRAGELRLREEALLREKEAVQRQREELLQERERLNATAISLRSRAQELEGFSKLASEKFNEGERALQEARRVEEEHTTRLRSVHAQMERLRLQELSLNQEQMRKTNHHIEAEGLRTTPTAPLPLPSAPLLQGSYRMGIVQSTLPIEVSFPSPGSSQMHARLALIRNSAEKDRDFLQGEQIFLETLKKEPYNSTLHTA